jgi:hypothetical protein
VLYPRVSALLYASIRELLQLHQFAAIDKDLFYINISHVSKAHARIRESSNPGRALLAQGYCFLPANRVMFVLIPKTFSC